jgi:hypothetical protein
MEKSSGALPYSTPAMKPLTHDNCFASSDVTSALM